MVNYTLGVAGRPSSDWESEEDLAEELERQLRGVRLLIHGGSEGWFLRDAIRDLRDYAADGRLLIVERIEAGRSFIEGCVGYTQPLLQGLDPATGQTIMRRATMLRLLIVRESEDRPELALRLCLEAQLRAAIRSMVDDEDRPHSIGAFGVILRSNEPALGWAQKLGPRARIVLPTDPIVERDPALSLVHAFAEDIRVSMKSDEPYCFVIANRRTLIEAATLHYTGRLPSVPGGEELNVFYDSADPYQTKIDLSADNISWGNPVTFGRMGLSGNPRATIWGPPETDQMRLGDDRPWREAT